MTDLLPFGSLPDQATVAALALDVALELAVPRREGVAAPASRDELLVLCEVLRTVPADDWQPAEHPPKAAPATRGRRREALVAAAAVTVAATGGLALGSALGTSPAGVPAAELRAGLHQGLVRLTSASPPAGVPAGGVLSDVVCTDISNCLGLVAGRGGPRVVRSTDGGSRWQPAGGTRSGVLSAIACPTVTRCVTVGSTTGRGTVLRSTDGGRSWSSEPAPAGVTALSGVACPSTTLCWAVGEGDRGPAVLTSSDGGWTWTTRSAPAGMHTVTVVGCTATWACELGGSVGGRPAFASTVDAGRTWTLAAVDPRGPVAPPGAVAALACTTDLRCWAAATSTRGRVAVLDMTAPGIWAVVSDRRVPSAGATFVEGSACAGSCGQASTNVVLRLLEGKGARAGPSVRPAGVSCPTAHECWVLHFVASGFSATALPTEPPSGGPGRSAAAGSPAAGTAAAGTAAAAAGTPRSPGASAKSVPGAG